MKITPILNDVKNIAKKVITNNKKNTAVKPIKNYNQYMKEYGLK